MDLHFAKPAEGRTPAVGAPAAGEQLAVPCAFMRGGSSRGGFFLASDLPADAIERDALLLAAYGSPDTRQIDGIGGSDPLTSKAAIVAPSARSDADVEYTFCQVGIDRAQVSIGGNCGNMISAVGPFAILRGLVEPEEPETTIRIFTTNTRQIVTARVPVLDGMPQIEGNCSIAGVPDPGAAIRLDFGDCSGAVSGQLLPTGRPVDIIEVAGREVQVSLVDAATPFVFVRAADLAAGGTELPDTILGNPGLLARLEEVRGWAAERLGLVDSSARASEISPNVPRVMMVTEPAGYVSTSGISVAPQDADLVVRQMAMQRPHRALAVTGAVCTAVASALPGTVVADCTASSGAERRIGHPGGVMRVAARVEADENNRLVIRSAEVERTARLVMDGMLYVRRRKLDAITDLLRRTQ